MARWRLVAITLVSLGIGFWIGRVRPTREEAFAHRLLKDAARAPAVQDYTAQATTFVRYGDRLLHSDARIYNTRGGFSRIEYFHGSLSGVVAVRTGSGATWRYDPLNRCMVTGFPHSGNDPGHEPEKEKDPFGTDLVPLLDNYRARVLRRTEAAGRPVAEILLRPMGSGGSRLLRIDEETGVILGSEERNAEGEIVAVTVYSSIRYGDHVPADKFLPLPPGGADGPPVRWRFEGSPALRSGRPEEIRGAIGASLIEPRYLPRGFEMEGHYLSRCSCCGMRTVVTRYGDGLKTLELAQMRNGCEKHRDQRPRDLGWGKVLFARRGESDHRVVGDLPDSELRRLRDSLPH